MTNIQGDVDQIITAQTVNNYTNNNEKSEPLELWQWEEIKNRMPELERVGFKRKFIFKYLMNTFNVQETKLIPRSKYNEALAEIERYVEMDLFEKQKKRKVHEILKLPEPMCGLAKKYAKDKFCTDTFNLLRFEQLEEVLHFVKARKRIKIGSIVVEWYREKA